MKRISSTIAVACFVCCLVSAQQDALLSYTVEKGIAEWISEGRTIEDTWPAILNVLVLMNYKATLADKAGGLLEAIYTSAGVSLMNVKDKDLSAVTIVAAETEAELKLTVKWKWGVGGPANSKKFYKDFFAKLAEQLK